MREQYLKAVKQCLPRRLRKQVLRDLEEMFDAAADHGESEGDVIARLGPPEAFAASFREEAQAHRPLLPVLTGAAGLLALALGLVLLTLLPSFSVGTIGSFDGPTQIYVTSGLPGSLPWWLIGGGVLLCVVSLVLFLRERRQKG